MKTPIILAAFLLAAQLVACGTGGSPGPVEPEKDEHKPTPEALAAMEKVQTSSLETCEKQTADAEAKLTLFLDKVGGKANDAMGSR